MTRIVRPHMCFDRIIPHDRKVDAAAISLSENRKNHPEVPARLMGVSMHPLKLALLTGKMWSNARILNISFLDGSVIQRKRVQQHAEIWMHYANIRLIFAKPSQSDIRISFVADDGSWSYVGTDNLSVPKKEPTMNFGWLRDDTEDKEYHRVVVHEFGHALGAIHEHQNPKSGIEWNKPLVYKYFSGPPNNWSRVEIDSNVLDKYSLSQINGTKFDRKSIMLYSFPKELILNGPATHENTQLSQGDKTFIAKAYSKGL